MLLLDSAVLGDLGWFLRRHGRHLWFHKVVRVKLGLGGGGGRGGWGCGDGGFLDGGEDVSEKVVVAGWGDDGVETGGIFNSTWVTLMGVGRLGGWHGCGVGAVRVVVHVGLIVSTVLIFSELVGVVGVLLVLLMQLVG